MKKILFCWLFLLLLSITHFAHAATEKSACNPQPLADDLIIPGPDNTCFAFRPIEVPGKSVFDGETFVMGDAEDDNFRMIRTEVKVGGSFYKESEKPVWIYYLGKYEITRAQYRAIMGDLPANLTDKESSPEKNNLPVTNLTYFEAMQFIDKLNQWLYANAFDELPKSENYPGFIRLPSEIEWEFAARGGMATRTKDRAIFESATPYGDEITAYEWFGGPKSSHGKMKNIGLLKPNPLGLHDMLGNVQEMTLSQYHLNYIEGRSGGFSSRGASYIMNKEELHSAQRREEPYYLFRSGKEIKPTAKITLGLRLAISAPILTDNDAIDEIEEAYDEKITSGTQAGRGMEPLGDQAEASNEKAIERIVGLKNLPENGYSNERWVRELNFIEDGIKDGQEKTNQAHADAAKVLVRNMNDFGQRITLLLQQVNALEDLNENADKTTEGYKRRLDSIKGFRATLKRIFIDYTDDLEALSAIPQHIAMENFINHKSLQESEAKEEKIGANRLDAILKCLVVSQEHYTQYVKTKHKNVEKWYNDYLELSKIVKFK